MTLDFKALRRQARLNLKRHYVLLVVLCAVSIIMGTEFKDVVSNAQTWYDLLTGRETSLEVEGLRRAGRSGRIIDRMIGNKLDAEREEADERLRALRARVADNPALGRQRGVLAAVVNNLNSGRLSAMLGTAAVAVMRSQQAAAVFMILLSLAFYGFIWVFFRNMYRAVLRRASLEARRYDTYPLSHLLHFRLVNRWGRAALTLFLQALYGGLWSLTVVGGVTQHYSYFPVPFIVAENPDLRPGEAITLSRRMMNGHKWECCRLELSFLGWRALGFVTFGIVDALWTVPYEMAAFSEYYVVLRAEAKARALEGAARLDDDCLFEPADQETLRDCYQDVARVEGVLDEDIVELSPVRRFFARNFGIWVGSLDEKKIFSRQQSLRQQTRLARLEMDGAAYPQRMNPLWTRENAAITGVVSYLTPCTVWSLIAVFFAFCMFGWLWEVSLHYMTDGEFVNRGTLHGPWLPIYGSGVAMITVLLYRFRRKPALEAALVTVLCGLVEYLSSYFLELARGMRWWDYTGYFLNLNGRICGEGLAMFAVGGMAAVYFLVPLIDTAVTKARPRAVIAVCAALTLAFAGDMVYSHFVPNAGHGITDIGEAEALSPDAGLALESPVEQEKR